MIVLDASAAIDWLLQTAAGQQIETRIYSRAESLHAPHLLDLEVAQVLRRLVREAAVSAQRADQVLQDLLSLRVTRYPHFVFLPHIWRLSRNLSAYDAAYVVLAEELGASLITRDARLASGSARGGNRRTVLTLGLARLSLAVRQTGVYCGVESSSRLSGLVANSFREVTPG